MAAAVPAKKPLSEVELNELSSNVLKLSAENKINQKNSWLLPLIDYMQDVVERQCSGEKTNFQVASVTLDASVKIFSNRVDSVHGIVYQVLGGLTRTERSPGDEEREDGGEGELDEDGTGGGRSAAGEAAKETRRAKKSHTSTIEQHPESLILRKVESEFDIDPLFRKMSAKFDEGGARGLLLNQLFVGSGCRLIFDSSETASGAADTDAHTDTAEADANAAVPAAVGVAAAAEPAPAKEFATAVTEQAEPAADPMLPAGDVTPPAFVPTSEPAATWSPAAASAATGAETEAETVAAAAAVPTAPVDLAPLMDASDDDAGVLDSDEAGPGMDDGPGAMGADSGSDAERAAASTAPGRRSAPVAPSTPKTPKTPAAAALAAAGDALGGLQLVLDADNEYGWFRADKLAGWAGPAHWKFRRAARAEEESLAGDSGKDKAAASAKSRTRKPKEAFKLDFSAPIDVAALLKRTRKAKVLGSDKPEEPITLPRDLHFSASSLRRPFLRPRFGLCRVAAGEALAMVPEPTLAARFASTATAAEPVDAGADCADDSGEDDAGPGGVDMFYDAAADFASDAEEAAAGAAAAAPLAAAAPCVAPGDAPTDAAARAPDSAPLTSTAAEADMSPLEAAPMAAGESLALVAAPAKVAKVDIGYAKVMKKVDVHALKAGMWRELQQQTRDTKRTSFATLVKRAPAYMPRDELADVSTPYCFICLLHLANEHSLRLTGNGSMTDVLVEAP